MINAPIVIKISGHELDDAAYLTQFAAVVAGMVNATPVIIVHGGGKSISAMQEQMGITPRHADGIRITDAASLSVVEMVLRGSVNTALVRVLINAGVDALGMSGVDRGMIRAEKMTHPHEDMGFTGRVTAASVRAELLSNLLAQGMTPVIAPLCLSMNGASAYNVNADHVAGAVAGAIGASRLIFLSNVPGVLVDGALIERLTPEKVERLIADGTIYGGMIPKVRTALEALTNGVKNAVITNLERLSGSGGTVFSTVI